MASGGGVNQSTFTSFAGSGGGAETVFTGLTQSFAGSGGGAGPEVFTRPQITAEFVANMTEAEFVETFGKYTVDPQHVRPCCSLFYTEETLEGVIKDIEFFKLEPNGRNPTLAECFTIILKEPDNILISPHSKIYCLTALLGNHYMDILATPARKNLWASLTDPLPDEIVANLTTHSSMNKLKSNNCKLNLKNYITTAYPTTSAFYYKTLDIQDPNSLLKVDETETTEYTDLLSKEYFYFIRRDLLTYKRKYDNYKTQLSKAAIAHASAESQEEKKEIYNDMIGIMINKNEALNALKSFIKILRNGKSYVPNKLENVGLFNSFINGDINGGSTGPNSTLVSIIPKASPQLYSFLEKYFREKRSDELSDEFSYYKKMWSLMPKPQSLINPPEKIIQSQPFLEKLNDWIKKVQAHKHEQNPYAFAFTKCSDAPEKLQSPMYELIVAQAFQKEDAESLMSLSALLFFNSENPRDRLINHLLRQNSTQDECVSCAILALMSKHSQPMSVMDTGCKASAKTAYEILEHYSQAIIGSSQDEDTQHAIFEVEKYIETVVKQYIEPEAEKDVYTLMNGPPNEEENKKISDESQTEDDIDKILADFKEEIDLPNKPQYHGAVRYGSRDGRDRDGRGRGRGRGSRDGRDGRGSRGSGHRGGGRKTKRQRQQKKSTRKKRR